MTGATEPVELLADLDRPDAWMLLAGGIVQSHVDLGDPRHLELEYVRRLGHVLDEAGAPGATHGPGAPLRVLHLGGGGLTLARYVAATRPGSRQVAIEADAQVANLVRGRLPLPPGDGQIEIRVADARAALGQIPAGSLDVVIADVFSGGRTPAHLTSVEFTAEAARTLAPGGIFAANISDGPPLTHARGRVAALRAVFRHVCLVAEPAVLAGRAFGNIVTVAAQHEPPVAGLAARAAADAVPARVRHGAGLTAFIAGAAPITDATAEASPPPPPQSFA